MTTPFELYFEPYITAFASTATGAAVAGAFIGATCVITTVCVIVNELRTGYRLRKNRETDAEVRKLLIEHAKRKRALESKSSEESPSSTFKTLGRFSEGLILRGDLVKSRISWYMYNRTATARLPADVCRSKFE